MQFQDCLWIKCVYHQLLILYREVGVLEPNLAVIGYILDRSQLQFIPVMTCRVNNHTL